MEENKTSIPLVFITTNTPYIRREELRAKIVKHWHKIEKHCELSKLFPKSPIMAYKRAQNLADTVISSKLPAVETPTVIKQKPPLNPARSPRRQPCPLIKCQSNWTTMIKNLYNAMLNYQVNKMLHKSKPPIS